MRMGDFGGVYLVTFIQMLPPSAFLEYFWVFGVFWGHFWVFEIFENVFGMRMCDFGGVYLVTFFKILPPSAFFWAMSKKRIVGWMDGSLIPVNCRAPCGANKCYVTNWTTETVYCHKVDS